MLGSSPFGGVPFAGETSESTVAFGATLTGVSTFVGGAAVGGGVIAATAAGMNITGPASFIGGIAIGASAATAPLCVITGESEWLAGRGLALDTRGRVVSRTVKIAREGRAMMVGK